MYSFNQSTAAKCSVPARLRHWSSAAPDCLPSATELFRSPLLVSGTVFMNMSLPHLLWLSSGPVSRHICLTYHIPTPCDCTVPAQWRSLLSDTIIVPVTYLLTYQSTSRQDDIRQQLVAYSRAKHRRPSSSSEWRRREAGWATWQGQGRHHARRTMSELTPSRAATCRTHDSVARPAIRNKKNISINNVTTWTSTLCVKANKVINAAFGSAHNFGIYQLTSGNYE